MQEIPTLTSRFFDALNLLSGLQDQFSTLPPDSLSQINADIERLCQTLEKSVVLKPAAGSDPPPVMTQPDTGPEYRMGMVLRKAHAGVFVRDLVNKTVRWSPELYELLGIDPATPSSSSTFMSMIHPDDYARVAEETQKVTEQGGTLYQEFRVIRPDGAILWLSSIGYVERSPDGCPLTLTGINQDITARKMAELAREEARVEAVNERNRLQAVMEALPIGVAILNTKAETIQANRGFEEVWGGPKPETTSIDDFAIYKAWWLLTGEPVQPEEWAAARAIQQGETVTNQLLEIEGFDGVHRFVLNSAAPFRDESGRIAGCAVAIRDISAYIRSERALKKSELALRESEERLRVALSSLPITTYLLDQDLRYVWVYNPQFGMTVEQMIGKRDDEIYPNVGKETLSQLQAVFQTGRGFQREIETDFFGEKKHFLLSVEPFLGDDSKPVGLIGARLDITQQRRLEMETREAIRQVELQRQILEHREKERAEIAREIHDGPIQTLVSMMFNLQVTKTVVEQAEVRQELDNFSLALKSAVRELRDVVNNLRPPALLRAGLAKTLQAYTEDFQEKHPELELTVTFDLPNQKYYFSEEITLSLYRLCQEGLNNIIRHAQATQAAIRFFKKGKKLVLEIKDNGKGFKVPADLSQKIQGGHYGLAGMKERADGLGGDLRIHSTRNKGTVVRISIPLEQADSPE